MAAEVGNGAEPPVEETSVPPPRPKPQAPGLVAQAQPAAQPVQPAPQEPLAPEQRAAAERTLAEQLATQQAAQKAQPAQAPQVPPAPAAQPVQAQPPAPAEPAPAAQPVIPTAPAIPPQPQPAELVQLPPTPMPPPPGWYGDIYGNSPRWWDGTIWTEHVLPPAPAPKPELSAFDNFVITVSLWPDWLKMLAVAAIVAGAILLAATLFGGGSSDPTDSIPQTPDSGLPVPAPDGSGLPN